MARNVNASGWTLNHDTLETRPLPDDIHPGLSAVMLVREALSEYNIPSQVDVTYKGMKRLSGTGAHHLTDGVLTCRATFRSLIGKKHEIDIPVIVHQGYMVYPEVFQDQGRIEVLAQSAFDEMLLQANVKQKMQDRLNMYSPHVFPIDLSEPKVQPGMFGVTAQVDPGAGRGFGTSGKEDTENLVEGQRYQVYGNRHVGTFSFRNPKTGKVEGYSRGPFSLVNARFVASSKGRDRVRKNKRREVHAFVEGAYSSNTAPVAEPVGYAYYNPFKTDTWQDLDTGVSFEEVTAPRVLMYFAEDGRPRVQYGEEYDFGVTARRIASPALAAAARWVMQNPQAVLTAIQAAPAVLNTMGALIQKVRAGDIQLPDAEALLAALPQLKEMAMSKQATHTPHGLDPAERDRADRLHPSQVVKLQSDVEVRLRGGSHVVYPSGTEVMIVRDMSDEGLIYYCEFPDGRRAPVHYDHLPD